MVKILDLILHVMGIQWKTESIEVKRWDFHCIRITLAIRYVDNRGQQWKQKPIRGPIIHTVNIYEAPTNGRHCSRYRNTAVNRAAKIPGFLTLLIHSTCCCYRPGKRWQWLGPRCSSGSSEKGSDISTHFEDSLHDLLKEWMWNITEKSQKWLQSFYPKRVGDTTYSDKETLQKE